jgi:hypothetical protein
VDTHLGANSAGAKMCYLGVNLQQRQAESLDFESLLPGAYLRKTFEKRAKTKNKKDGSSHAYLIQAGCVLSPHLTPGIRKLPKSPICLSQRPKTR